MENYWSSLVWQGGGDILSPDKQDRRHRHRRGGGRHPVPPGPHLQGQGHGAARGSAHDGRQFENGQAAMEANGSWLVPTHEAAGLDFDVAPLPEGPGGPGDVGQPERRRRLQGLQGAGRRLGVREVLTGPELQAMVASLKASMPVNKQVLTDQYATSFDGGKTFADALVVRAPQAVVQGLRRVHDDAPGGARREGVQRQPDDREGRARRGHAAAAAAPRPVRPVAPAWTTGPGVTRPPGLGDAVRAVSRPSGRPGPAAGRDRRGTLGRSCSWRPRSSGWRSCPPARSSPRSGSASRSGTCSRRRSSSASTTTSRLVDDARFLISLRNTAFYTIVSVPLGMALALGLAIALNQQIRGIALDPHRVLPAARDVRDGDRARMALDLQPDAGC